MDDAEREALQKRIGQNIATTRRQLQLTQEGLAERSGLHPVEVGRAERGKRDMRVSTLVRLARGLGVSSSELLANVD